MMRRIRYTEKADSGSDAACPPDDAPLLNESAVTELVEYARKQLYDYYGTASQFFPVAQADLIRIEDMSTDEIVAEARKHRLI